MILNKSNWMKKNLNKTKDPEWKQKSLNKLRWAWMGLNESRSALMNLN